MKNYLHPKFLFVLFMCLLASSTQAFSTAKACILYPLSDTCILNFDLGTIVEGCEGDTIVLNSPLQDDTLTFLWSTGATTPSISINTSGIFTCTVSSTSCFGVDSVQVQLKPKPNANFVAESVCEGSPTIFENGSTSLPNAVYLWRFGDGDTSDISSALIQHNYSGASLNYSASLFIDNLNGCIDSISKQIEIKPIPIVSITADTVCAESPTSFIASVSALPGATYLWDFGDNVTSTVAFGSIQHTYPAQVLNYTARLTIDNLNGCTATATTAIQLKAKPTAEFSTDLVCLGSPTNFSNTSIARPGATYIWRFGDGDTSSISNATFSHTYPGPLLNYTAILLISNLNGCVDSISRQVQIKAIPVVFIAADTVCAGAPTNFTNTSFALPNAIHTWNFGDGNILNNSTSTIQHTYPMQPLSYFARLTIDNLNGCSDTDSLEILLKPTPIPAISANTVCKGSPTTFTNGSAALPGATFQLNFGDGNSSNIPFNELTHTYGGSALNYNASLTVINPNGCFSSVIYGVSLLAQPVAQFSVDTACLGTPTTFTNSSSALPNAVFNWEFGDGNDTIASVSSLQFTYPGQSLQYLATLIIDNQNTCKDTLSRVVSIFSLPIVTSSGAASYYCERDPIATLEGNPSGGIFSGPGVQDNPALSDNIGFFNPSTPAENLHIVYTFFDGNGCVGSDTQIVLQIFSLPQLSFNGLATTYCEKGAADTLIANVSGGVFSGSLVENLQGGVTSSALFNPSLSGNYLVNFAYTDSNGCSNNYTASTIVHPLPLVNLGSDTFILPGQTLVLSGGISSDYIYSWSNGTNSPTLTISNPGFYVLTINSASTGCLASDTIFVDLGSNLLDHLPFLDSVTIYPNPTSSAFTLEFLPSYSGDILVMLCNYSGQVIQTEKLQLSKDILFRQIWEIQHLPDGLYFLKIAGSTFKIIKKTG